MGSPTPELASPCISERRSPAQPRRRQLALGPLQGPARGQDSGGNPSRCSEATAVQPHLHLPPNSSHSVSASRESLVSWGPLAGKGPQEKM